MTLMFTALHIGLFRTVHRLYLQANTYVREFCGKCAWPECVYVLCVCACVCEFKPICVLYMYI